MIVSSIYTAIGYLHQNKIYSMLEDELKIEISLEIETIFNEYTENFLGLFFILGLENFQHIR